jgi:hypothetical protein
VEIKPPEISLIHEYPTPNGQSSVFNPASYLLNSSSMPHSTEAEPGVVEAILEYYAPNSDGTLPDANDLEVRRIWISKRSKLVTCGLANSSWRKMDSL